MRRPPGGDVSSRRRMRVIGIDTNVVVRWLTDDQSDPAQAQKAMELFARERLHLSIAATVETFWVLESIYRVARADIGRVARTLLETPNLDIQNKLQLQQAVDAQAEHRGDLTDHFIAALNEAVGCEYTATFDKKAARSKRFKLV
jgi:predicted nucleic-acid-binding protein